MVNHSNSQREVHINFFYSSEALSHRGEWTYTQLASGYYGNSSERWLLCYITPLRKFFMWFSPCYIVNLYWLRYSYVFASPLDCFVLWNYAKWLKICKWLKSIHNTSWPHTVSSIYNSVDTEHRGLCSQ